MDRAELATGIAGAGRRRSILAPQRRLESCDDPQTHALCGRAIPRFELWSDHQTLALTHCGV